jgi:hypothetical protein
MVMGFISELFLPTGFRHCFVLVIVPYGTRNNSSQRVV